MAVAVMPGMGVMTTSVLGGHREPAYRALMGWIDRRLGEVDDYGLVLVWAVLAPARPRLRSVLRSLRFGKPLFGHRAIEGAGYAEGRCDAVRAPSDRGV
jgi:hypothetical protein